jgi:S-formylglutathione hydrolase FrmB
MAFCPVQFYSPSLLKACSMNVLLPDRVESAGPYPVLYLLHGLSDDHTIWPRRTSLERYVEGLPLIVVMPDGGRSFYCDAVEGAAYETHLVRDVVGFADRFFPTLASRKGRAICGLSMGGYGAVKLALKFPETFGSAVSHSGALAYTRRSELAPEFRRIFGPSASGGKDCPFALAERADRETFPALRFDCGTEDGLLEENRAFHRHLRDLDLPHEYEEFPGGHNWAYWDLHVQEAIGFHRRALGI